MIDAAVRDLVRPALLVAAVADRDSLGEILAAAGLPMGTPVDVRDLLPAANAQVTDIDGMATRFRHPLLRSAVHQESDVAERYTALSALAEVQRLPASWSLEYQQDPVRSLRVPGGRSASR